MRQSSARGEFWAGVRGTIPFLLVVVPFSMLFGLVATQAGLNLLETMTFSLVVIAGAAQFAALGLLQEQAPVIIVVLSALAVNLRMAMYSAALVPHLGPLPFWERVLAAYTLVDQPYALMATRFDNDFETPLRHKAAFFWGSTCVIVPMWWGFTLVGAVTGAAIPAWIPLDFALPIAFLAVIAPMLRTRAHVIAALVGSVGALIFVALPFNLGLIVGGLTGMMAGAEAERRGLA